MKRICLICHENIKPGSSMLRAVLWHFRPLEIRPNWGYFRGTFRMGGLRAVLTLASPLLNTLLNWKYLRCRLTAPFCALDDTPQA